MKSLQAYAEYVGKRDGDYDRVCGSNNEEQDLVLSTAITEIKRISGGKFYCKKPILGQAVTWAALTTLKGSDNGSTFWCADSAGSFKGANGLPGLGKPMSEIRENSYRDEHSTIVLCEGGTVYPYYPVSYILGFSDGLMRFENGGVKLQPKIEILNLSQGEIITRGSKHVVKWSLLNPDNVPTFLTLSIKNVNSGYSTPVLKHERSEGKNSIDPSYAKEDGYVWEVPTSLSPGDYAMEATLILKYWDAAIATSTEVFFTLK